MPEEKEKPKPEKKVRLKLTGEYCGRLIMKGGQVVFCDSRLPAGKTHIELLEKEAERLIAERKKTLKRQGKSGIDLVKY